MHAICCLCNLSSVAMDGEGGLGLKLEKLDQLFKILILCLQNSLNNYYG